MAHKKQLTTHRNYKDTIFRMLFSDRKNLLSLYNAVSGAHYEDPEMLEIVTLENAIYMGMKNDLAFIIDTDLFLYEHQSTYNPNMPLRDLFYISSEYQKLVDKKSLYSSVLQKIPAPQFIVFYNGTEKEKDSWVNHLSEAFQNLSGNCGCAKFLSQLLIIFDTNFRKIFSEFNTRNGGIFALRFFDI